MQIGPVIREVREQAGLSQEEIARRAGLSRVYINLLEAGKRAPSLETFVAIAKALNIKASKLLAKCE